MASSYLIIIYFFIFLFGASLSSFCHLYFYRRERNEDFIFKRSYCENCRHVLKFYDLIPVFSYISNKGRCRYCGEKIGFDKLILELLSGALAVFIFYRYGFRIYSIFLLLEIILILFIGYIDLATGYIYTADILVLFVIEIVLKIFFSKIFYYSIIGAFALGIIFAIIYKVTGMMGLGDVIYAFVCGFIARDFFEIILFFNISFISAAFVSLILIILKKKSLKSSISFGPYMSFSLILLLILR